jgi:putative CocE/NonD family hydrolase
VNPEHKSKYSAWETPDPVFWTSKGYVVVRCDERGLGQSPGLLDTMSRSTSECFFDVVEWASEQPWSSGKVGLLGISYYAGMYLIMFHSENQLMDMNRQSVASSGTQAQGPRCNSAMGRHDRLLS